MAFSSLPVMAGYAAQTSTQRFVGVFFDRQDYAVHMAMLHYGELGNWDYQFRFTTEPQPTAYLRTIYVIIGHLAGWTRIPTDLLFQLARLGFGLLACLSIYYLLTRIFSSSDQIKLAFILAILGAGLGWVQMPFGLVPDHNISPMDFWLIDAYVFFDLATLPHLSLVLAIMALSIALFLDHLKHPSRLSIALIAAAAIPAQMINPIAFVLVDTALVGAVAFSFWQKRRLDWGLVVTLGLLFVVQIPLLLYSLVLLTRDPAWAEFNRQNITLTPPPIYLLLGFALFWPFVIWGSIKALQQRDQKAGWALVWVVSAIGMAYLPLVVQRRFLLGLSVPLAVLATPAILEFSAWVQHRLPISRLGAAIVIGALATLTPFVMIGAYTVGMYSRPAMLFEPAALVDALDWLGANAGSNQVVLAAEPTAQLVAMRTPLRLYFGHEMETLYYKDKAKQVQDYYRGLQPAGWAESQGIDWVILGPHEKPLGQGGLDYSDVTIAYQNDLVAIYRIATP